MSNIDHEAAKRVCEARLHERMHPSSADANIARAYLDQTARVEALAVLCKQAIEAVESWGEYASDYFKEKHNLAGDIEQMQAELARIMEDS
jgi:hypothetical protein